jgi:hypothetical protein
MPRGLYAAAFFTDAVWIDEKLPARALIEGPQELPFRLSVYYTSNRHPVDSGKNVA